LVVASAAAGVACGGGGSSSLGPSGPDGGSDAQPADDGSSSLGDGAAAHDDASTDSASSASGDSAAEGGAGPYTVGGSVTGLVGSGLVLQDNAGDNLTISSADSFVFPTALAGGSAFDVTVLSQPGMPSQTCAVTGGTGTGSVNGADVTSVSVSCTTDSYTVGGKVTGLSGTIVLADNGGDALSLDANGAFAFATPIASDSMYTVTIKTQPASQTCSVSGGTGTVGSGDITGVVVNCSASGHTVGGTISGLTGSAVLQDNGGDDLTLNANGTFAFATPLGAGSPYDVTVATQPAGETCTVTNGGGSVGGSNVASVSVSCTANLYTIGGTLEGLAAGGMVTLQDNGGNNLTQSSNGTFTFSTPLATGASYNVTVSAQPAGQRCVASGGSGKVGSGNVSSVVVNCAANSYTVGGTISGLVGAAVLQDNGGDNLTLTSNGSFAFTTPLSTGAMYAVTILTQPANETCVVAKGTGVVGLGNVTSVNVTCSGAPESVGGTLWGLGSSSSVTLQDNGGNNVTLTSNGAFAFSQKVAYGAAYDVTVLAQPLGQVCTVTNGSGTISGNVSNVTVTCTAKHYTIGGNLQGLGAGKSVTLQDNGGDNLVLTATGPFTFATTVPGATMYTVTVAFPPSGQTCTVTNGTGTVALANVSDVIVVCH
jgi:hypothetical protein